MNDIRKVEIISKKPLEKGFEYFIRMPNRRMITLISERDLPVGNSAYVVCNYFAGEFFNVSFA